MTRGGPWDGKAARKVPNFKLSVPFPQDEHRLEAQMNAIVLKEAKVDYKILRKNNYEWLKALLPLLVDEATTLEISGGESECSEYCLNEEKMLGI